MTNQEINKMTRQDAINNIKSEITETEAGLESETFLGIEINPKDILPKKYEGLKALETMTDNHFEISREYND